MNKSISAFIYVGIVSQHIHNYNVLFPMSQFHVMGNSGPDTTYYHYNIVFSIPHREYIVVVVIDQLSCIPGSCIHSWYHRYSSFLDKAAIRFWYNQTKPSSWCSDIRVCICHADWYIWCQLYHRTQTASSAIR